MDEAEFDELFESSFQRLCGQVFAVCGSASEAQDCVQEAFIRAWERRVEVGRHPNKEAWVRRTASNLAVSRWRKHGRRSAALTVDHPGDVGPSPDRVALERALGALKPQHRRAVVLHYMVGLPVREVAEEMDTPVNTIKTWLSRARGQLAGLVDEVSHG